MKIARYALGNATPAWGLVDSGTGIVRPIRASFASWAPAVTDGAGSEVLALADERLPLASLHLLPPLETGAQAFAVGANYQKHLDELKMAPPAAPIAFLKSARALIGANDDIFHASLTTQLDYEVELVAIIGKPLADPIDPTLSVLGYTVGNDVSARDLQRTGLGFDLFSAKSLDHTSGLGPWLVTRDEFGPGTPDLRLALSVNGEARQDSRTSLMRWKLDELLHYIDRRSALRRGDLLFTGTPEGVAWASGRFLNPGDVVEATIEKIGTIRNRVVAS
jgi:2-keto-4-pentenoate hydratase/2-oxohepta-3-ene-1,7-dioic acid hydratase in catechol pathway